MGRNSLHPTLGFFGTSLSVNRLQPFFINEVVVGEKKHTHRTTAQLEQKQTSAQPWMLTNKQQWALKTNTHYTTPPFSSISSRRATAPHSPSKDGGKMSGSDRMGRKLEKDWEITRCLWKTPLCYFPPAHIRVNRVLSWKEHTGKCSADNGRDGRQWQQSQ